MKIKLSIILLLAALLFSNCKFVMLKMYGIKKPKFETEKSIIRFAEKKHLRTNNIVTVNANDFLSILKQGGVPEVDIFDSEGQYIEYRKTDSSCNVGVFDFIPALHTNTQYNKTGKKNLANELIKFRDLNGNNLSPIDKADFYLLIYWATWAGKLNKDHVKIWEDSAYANKNANIKVIKVNMDFQENWDQADKDLFIAPSKKKKKKVDS